MKNSPLHLRKVINRTKSQSIHNQRIRRWKNQTKKNNNNNTRKKTNTQAILTMKMKTMRWRRTYRASSTSMKLQMHLIVVLRSIRPTLLFKFLSINIYCNNNSCQIINTNRFKIKLQKVRLYFMDFNRFMESSEIRRRHLLNN